MLRGGFADGSTTLLAGPSGTGKTVASPHFAGTVTPENPCLFLGFYESPERLRRKASGIGLDLAALEADGALALHWRSPAEMLVDEVARWLLDELRRTGARRLVVDGIAGFQQNLIESGRMSRFLTALGNELRALRVTTLYTSAMTGNEPSTALMPQGIAEWSPLIDSVISLRLVERNEALTKLLSIVKVPDRDFDARITTYTIGPGGIALAGRGENRVAKILLAEDEAVIRMLLAEMLSDDGHQVIEAADGVQALTLLEPDVAMLISDVMMPRLAGDERITVARRRPGMDRVPVILMSAPPLPPTATALATAVLQKPFRLTALVKIVQNILTGSPPPPYGSTPP